MQNHDEILRRWHLLLSSQNLSLVSPDLTRSPSLETLRDKLEQILPLLSELAIGDALEKCGQLSLREYRCFLKAWDETYFESLEKKHQVQAVESSAIITQLQAERDYRENFFLTIAHDLRSPLTAIRACSEMIVRQPENLERNAALAHRLVATSDRMDRMISNLLDSSQIQAGKRLHLDFEEVDLIVVISETLHNLTASHGDRFIFEAASSMRGFWNADALTRILENLGTNAIKYGAPEAPITIQAKPFLDHIELSVHNIGNPIGPEERSQLFQLFRRTDQAQKGTQKGWGIGLVLIKGLAQAHGGSVTIESDVKNGTTFTVSLPFDSRQGGVCNEER